MKSLGQNLFDNLVKRNLARSSAGKDDLRSRATSTNGSQDVAEKKEVVVEEAPASTPAQVSEARSDVTSSVSVQEKPAKTKAKESPKADTQDAHSHEWTEGGLGKQLYVHLKDLNSKLDILDRTIPPLEAALSAREEAGFFGSTTNVNAFKLYLKSIADEMGTIETTILPLEVELSRSTPQPRAEFFKQLFGRSPNPLRQQLRALSARLDALEYTIPRLEFAIAARAESLMEAPAERDRLYDLQDYIDDVSKRLQTLHDIVPPLEEALSRRIPLPTPEPIYLRAWEGAAALGVTFISRFRREPKPQTLEDLIDMERGGGPVVFEDDSERRVTWRESWWSRRRLQLAILPFAILALLMGYFAAFWLNGDYQKQQFAKRTVRDMVNAPSYMATGFDIVRTGSNIQEVREEFAYVAPSQVQTNYITSARTGDGGASLPVDCHDKEITVITSTRYQYCADPDQRGNGWRVDSFDPSVLERPIFRPWIRFSWCRRISEDPTPQVINGEETTMFSCSVPPEVEADINEEWVNPEEGSRFFNERQEFIQKGSVDVSVWVRKKDGYIGRFAMQKVSPQGSQTVTETVDYTYRFFGQVPDIQPPVILTEADRVQPEPAATGAADESIIQSLDLPEIAIINGAAIRLEVAADQETLSRGLSNRPVLPEDTGMLFVFPEQDIWTFWMKDVLFPVDVIFIDSEGLIVDIQTMQTEPGVPDDQLTRYNSAGPALFALEINAGIAESLGFEVGQQVQFQ